MVATGNLAFLAGRPVFLFSKKGEVDMSIEERRKELEQYKDKAPEIKPQKEVELPKAWQLSDKGKEAIQIAVEMSNTKHGMYASVPMLCKAEECPYAKVCPLISMGKAPEGERCPIEIGMILTKYEDYADEFGIDEKNIVDMGFVKDLIDCDIQVFRAENKMAIDGDFIEEFTVTVTEAGEEINDIRLSKAVEYKDKILSKKHKILQLMNSTRKDKAGTVQSSVLDPSSYAAQLMQSFANQAPIEADYEEVDDE